MDQRVGRVRATWALAAGDADRTARVFYSNLFRLDPTTKPLFVGDLDLQGRKLTQTLSYIVDHLEDADSLMPSAVELARRHVGYGVVADQYASVGAALIQTFKQLLGPAFTDADEKAWRDTYQALSDAMVAAAYPA
ncbi:globin domain-containing protein [Roseicyclus elongatus]|uniref:globin domain-containing protein n=1 Tax=Roseicyclus elongatus TaxID=159346 RepID=UPI000A02E8FD|nr:globin domain-containing protein [Roseibacterium elongatum]